MFIGTHDLFPRLDSFLRNKYLHISMVKMHITGIPVAVMIDSWHNLENIPIVSKPIHLNFFLNLTINRGKAHKNIPSGLSQIRKKTRISSKMIKIQKAKIPNPFSPARLISKQWPNSPVLPQQNLWYWPPGLHQSFPWQDYEQYIRLWHREHFFNDTFWA